MQQHLASKQLTQEQRAEVEDSIAKLKSFIATFKNLQVEGALIEIINGTHDFSGQEIVLRIIQGLEKKDIVKYLQDNIAKGGRRAVWLALIAEEGKEKLEELQSKSELELELVEMNSESVKEWKDRQKEVYENLYSFIEKEENREHRNPKQEA